MIFWSWLAAVVLAVLIIVLFAYLIANPDTFFVAICVITALLVLVLVAAIAQEYIFLPWMQTWDVGW